MISVNIVRNWAKLHKYISTHIRGREIPTDADIQIRHNGCVLSDYSKVQSSDTLYLKATRQGLHGGSSAKIETEGDEVNKALKKTFARNSMSREELDDQVEAKL